MVVWCPAHVALRFGDECHLIELLFSGFTSFQFSCPSALSALANSVFALCICCGSVVWRGVVVVLDGGAHLSSRLLQPYQRDHRRRRGHSTVPRALSAEQVKRRHFVAALVAPCFALGQPHQAATRWRQCVLKRGGRVVEGSCRGSVVE